ncbi:CHAT domain-containing protein [Actinoplanes couchii]|uniref:CHAT domain-containing protein n=1 Tax=Actinoplanes couchii TaxID=403638 RepID=A0ABQ3XDQ0_9ACTN|nr:CHAT domain-containing protein [Actinoplanes couchii]MDR6317132.1 CHAT domain-containing protein [Actinoplanes couchii]GID56627.1 hypothetical protein Aco03nite_050310 [Actinoplanes couchii]
MIAELILIGQHRLDPEAARVASGPGVEAAAALAGGEPQRAMRCLPDGDDGALLGYLATVIDYQWTPRGTGSALAGDAAGALVTAGGRLTATARATPLGVLATRILPELLVAQAVSDDEQRSGITALTGQAVRRLASLDFSLSSASTPGFPSSLGSASAPGFPSAPGSPSAASSPSASASAFALLVMADLAHRAGDSAGAAALVDRALDGCGDDGAVRAHAAVIRGDWATGPGTHPESLGLSFRPFSVTVTPFTLHTTAIAAYDEAEALWTSIGSRAGVASVALRRAHVLRLRDDAEARDEELSRALRLAGDAGNGALVALARVHQLVDTIATHRHAPAEGIDPVRLWAERDGSRSYRRGLVHLLVVRARRWRDDGDFTRARAVLTLAQRLAGTDGYRHDGASVSIDLAALYGGAGYRRAAFVLADRELAGCTSADHDPVLFTSTGRDPAAGRPVAAVEWVRLAVRAHELVAEAHDQADPDLLTLAGHRIQGLLALPVRRGDDADDRSVVQVRQMLSAQLENLPGAAAWYTAQRLRDAGDEEAALTAFGEARDRTRGDVLLHCAVLASVPLRAEAGELAQALAPHLPPLLAARFFLRLADLDEAERHPGGALRSLHEGVRPPGGASPFLEEAARYLDRVTVTPEPWTLPAMWASLRRLQHRPADQARHAAEAVALFEERQNGLSRDLLRGAATDDWTVAEAYRDLATGLTGIAALTAADRARGLPALLLADLAALPEHARSTARDWLAANSRWAAVFERRASAFESRASTFESRFGTVESGDDRAGADRLDAAERALDEAEERVRRVAPELLARRVAAPADLTASIGRLPAGTVLLAYHLFREEITGWAVTAAGTAATLGPVPVRGLVGVINGWQRELRYGRTDPRAAERLAAVLLGPFREVIGRHHRIIVVPHRELSLVPFHALPELTGHDVGYLPAVSLLDRLAGRPPLDLTRGAVLLGDPASSAGLPPLPGTRCEVQAIRRHFPGTDARRTLPGVEDSRAFPGRDVRRTSPGAEDGRAFPGAEESRAFPGAEVRRAVPGADVLLGSDATLAALRVASPGRSVVHLATHAIVEPGRPNLSSVLLAGDDRLTVAGLLGGDVTGDLLVLSACQTGQGTPTRAGDMSGLVRAALIAGFADVVVTLWPIHDQIAAVTMDRFHTHLAAAPDVSHALAEARRDVRALSSMDLIEAYGRLPGAGPDALAPMRDASAAGACPPDLLHGWAAFAHIGVPR